MRRVPLPWKERQLCRVWIGRWALQHAKGLGWDLVQAGRMMLHSRTWRTQLYADERRWL